MLKSLVTKLTGALTGIATPETGLVVVHCDSRVEPDKSDSDQSSDTAEAPNLSIDLYKQDKSDVLNESTQQWIKQMQKTSDKKEEDTDFWDEDWDAIRHEIKKFDRLEHLPTVADDKVVNGMITTLNLEAKEIIINFNERCQYDRCTYGQPMRYDMVKICRVAGETVVMPLRQKCFTGKITAHEADRYQFVFSKNAYMLVNDETRHLKVEDVIRCLVVECKYQKYNWRAIPLPKNHVDEPDDNDKMINDLIENKEGVEIETSIRFDVQLGTSKPFDVVIKNTGQSTKTLLECANEPGETQIEVEGVKVMENFVGLPYELRPGRECRVVLVCQAQYIGDSSQLILFKFDGFNIGRFAQVTVFDRCGSRWVSSANRQQRETKAYEELRHTRMTIFGDQTWVLKGERIWPGTKHIHDKIGHYRVPDAIWNVLEKGSEVAKELLVLKKPLNMDTYEAKFKLLIHLEECQNQVNLHQYNLDNVTFTKNGDFFVLNVPGLADGRPSLIIGDKIFVDVKLNIDTLENGAKNGPSVFEGFIHDIRLNEVLVKFHSLFHQHYNSEPCKVNFQISRMLIRRSHFVVELSKYIGPQVLFPETILLKKPIKKVAFTSIAWHNNDLNQRQKLAVCGVLRSECRPTPYIIFGPPGTGKTMTLVECILQVFTLVKHSRIIACTCANSSADLIAKKLLESGKITENDLVRISAFYRMNSVPQELKKITRIAEENESTWLYHRIIVTTSCQAGIVYRHRVSPHHFTHVFIDEAAQITEPEVMIPIALVAIGHGSVILAGDHLQLGPVIMSPEAKRHGFGQSFMERLMELQPYKRNDVYEKYGHYNPKFITKLIINYRSDSRIMKIPSEVFYESELNFFVESDQQLLDHLNLKHPCVFHGNRGDDQRSDDSPSWFNHSEVLIVAIYLMRLANAGLTAEEVGIITPYRKQVEMIRRHIRKENLLDSKVGTIEEFQGDERKVIIVSMVRSSFRNLPHDQKFNLGFIHNPKRFNVIISRAMSLLIVIGDAEVLARDRNWIKFVEYCKENDTVVGNFSTLRKLNTAFRI